MLLPRIFGENLFDDFFNFPDFGKMERDVQRRLYGHNAGNLMKTDVKENEDSYELIIDLPGFTKEEVKAELNDGYLTVYAEKNLNEDEKEKDTGRYLRRERYTGSCSRSFYVGEDVRQEDIKAEFQHGLLTLKLPKEQPKVEEKKPKYIEISG